MNILMTSGNTNNGPKIERVSHTNEALKRYLLKLSKLDADIATAEKSKVELVRSSLSDLSVPEAAILSHLSSVCMECFYNMVSDSMSVDYKRAHNHD